MLHEKIEGKSFLGSYGREIKYYNSAFLIYCMLYQKCRITILNRKFFSTPSNLAPSFGVTPFEFMEKLYVS